MLTSALGGLGAIGEDIPEKGPLCQFIKAEHQLDRHEIEKQWGSVCKYTGE